MRLRPLAGSEYAPCRRPFFDDSMYMSAAQAQNSSDEVTLSAAGFGQATLLGGLIGLTLYGVFFVLFCATLYVMSVRSKTTPFNYPLSMAAIIIFSLSSVDAVLKSRRLMIGLLYTPFPYTADEYFQLSYDWTYSMEVAVIELAMLTADAVLLYRVWIVWGNRWRFVAVNGLLWLASLAISTRVFQLQVMTTQSPGDISVVLPLEEWSVISQSLSLAQTVTATGLIASRLWLVDRAVSRYKQGTLLPVIRIVVESGSIYGLLQLVYLPFMRTGIPTDELLVQLMCPTIGITFSLIIVRVGLDLNGERQGPVGPIIRSCARSQPVDISVRREVEIETGDRMEETSAFEDRKECFVMRRRDSLSSNSV